MPRRQHIKITAPKIVRLKQHRPTLSRLADDISLGTSRRLLAEMIALWIDADESEAKFLRSVIEAQFGTNPKRIQWADPTDPASPVHRDELEKTGAVRTAYENFMQAGRPSDDDSEG